MSRTINAQQLTADDVNCEKLSIAGLDSHALRVLDTNEGTGVVIDAALYDVAIIRADNGSGGSNAATLLDGAVTGESIYIYVKDATGVNATIAGSFYDPADGTASASLTIANKGQMHFVWGGARGWLVLGGKSFGTW